MRVSGSACWNFTQSMNLLFLCWAKEASTSLTLNLHLNRAREVSSQPPRSSSRASVRPATRQAHSWSSTKCSAGLGAQVRRVKGSSCHVRSSIPLHGTNLAAWVDRYGGALLMPHTYPLLWHDVFMPAVVNAPSLVLQASYGHMSCTG